MKIAILIYLLVNYIFIASNKQDMRHLSAINVRLHGGMSGIVPREKTEGNTISPVTGDIWGQLTSFDQCLKCGQ
jgi:hypothetical protein